MYATREEWLGALANGMAPWFGDLDVPLPKYRIAIGFPSTGRRGKRIGECWDGKASADKTFEVFIRPDRFDVMEIAGILAHELTHAAVGIDTGHGRAFRRVAVAIGLTGKMTATVPGNAFKQHVEPILEKLGAIPHARLSWGKSSGPKKQTTRMIKCECGECGYTARVARKWLDEIGAPHCPEHGEMKVEAPEAEEEAGLAEAA